MKNRKLLEKVLREEFQKILENSQAEGDKSDYGLGYDAGYAVGMKKVDEEQFKEGYRDGVNAGAQAWTTLKHRKNG